MKIDKKIIKELNEYLEEFNLTEIEITEKDTKIKVSKNIGTNINQPSIVEHNSRIEKNAEMILSDSISLDEQEQNKLKKYHDFAKQNYGLEQDAASELVNEAFLYLKLKQAPDIDPLTKGDEFGAGFS